MRSLVILALLTTVFEAVLGAACSGNNCLRAVSRVATGRNGTVDCMSFFRVTATPLPSTIRSTLTITTTVPAAYKRWNTVVASRDVGEIHGFHDLNEDLAAAPLQHRQVTQSPSVIPLYASACSSVAAYSSACSCIGVSHITITAAGSTTIAVSTITETVTSTPLPTKIVDTPTSISSTSSPSDTAPSSQTITTSPPSTTLPTNSTLPPYGANSTTPYANSTSPTISPTLVLDTSCGETATPFQLQVSQPSGPFNDWYAYLSGDGVLFTSDSSAATSFSVEGSHHLCAVGYTGEFGLPIIAVVGNVTDSSGVWLLDGRVAEALEADYVPVECEVDAGGLKCHGQGRENWLGCGLQLDLGSSGNGTVVGDGVQCSEIELKVV
ncbi:hypothetical protein DL546_005873 [Coniochaeta pulveracea]|uniref:Uncharacterized protein n=1 Tax=Coniochaeta pulveracea TaxID=177199 RepID=A0A420Y6S2_9PEZI|nr:hypothetical protein DL546_005873 [Coniochaeta pulveracea]